MLNNNVKMFFYGGSGVGKSTIVARIANEINKIKGTRTFWISFDGNEETIIENGWVNKGGFYKIPKQKETGVIDFQELDKKINGIFDFVNKKGIKGYNLVLDGITDLFNDTTDYNPEIAGMKSIYDVNKPTYNDFGRSNKIVTRILNKILEWNGNIFLIGHEIKQNDTEKIDQLGGTIIQPDLRVKHLRSIMRSFRYIWNMQKQINVKDESVNRTLRINNDYNQTFCVSNISTKFGADGEAISVIPNYLVNPKPIEILKILGIEKTIKTKKITKKITKNKIGTKNV